MSYYYSYYIGYKKDGKIYPWGPYNAKGKLEPVISRSRSFASSLYENFHLVREKQVSEELRKEFEYEDDWTETKQIDVKYLLEKELPTGSYIKTGYFLIKDVEAYKNNKYNFEGFFDVVSPEIYAAKLQHEMIFGKNQPKVDVEEGYEYTEPNASDYMYYAYPDYNTEEYESFILRQAIDALRDYSMENVEYVVLEIEG